jgi:uncharacterized protein YqeY
VNAENELKITPMSLLEQIDQDIKTAMLARDSKRMSGLRAIKSAILLARTEKGSTGELSPAAEISLLQKLVKQRRESAEIYKNQNRTDLCQVEIDEVEVIEAYLPQQLSHEEIAAIVKKIIGQSGASGIKDIGRVMGIASKELAGRADGRTISMMVKEQLS